MFDELLGGSETRRILIYLGGAGALALVGGGIYAASISAVTPSFGLVSTTTLADSSGATPIAPTPSTAPQLPTITLKGENIRVTVADTLEERSKGLSGRTSLARDEGMLFVFDTDGQYGFWMKDMHFAIDILWLSPTGEILYVVENAMPESYPAAFVPPLPARHVLELPAGWVRAHGVSLGDKVEL